MNPSTSDDGTLPWIPASIPLPAPRIGAHHFPPPRGASVPVSVPAHPPPSSSQHAPPPGSPVYITMASGGLARVTTVVLMMPFDTIKTRLQFQGTLATGANAILRIRYRSAWDALTRIFQEEGLFGLYRALPTRLAYAFPATAVSFTMYELVKRQVVDPEWKSKLTRIGWDNYIVGSILARMLGTMVRTPFDIIKTRMEIQGMLTTGWYSSNWDALNKTCRQEGISGMFRGYGVTLLRDLPFAGIYFASYEGMKMVQSSLGMGVAEEGEAGRHLRARNHFVAGALAGAIAATCTYPFDVIKTRIQTQTQIYAHPIARKALHGFFDCIRTLYREEGWHVFWRGLTLRILYISPTAACTFAFYEMYKRVLGRWWRRYWQATTQPSRPYPSSSIEEDGRSIPMKAK